MSKQQGRKKEIAASGSQPKGISLKQGMKLKPGAKVPSTAMSSSNSSSKSSRHAAALQATLGKKLNSNGESFFYLGISLVLKQRLP